MIRLIAQITDWWGSATVIGAELIEQEQPP